LRNLIPHFIQQKFKAGSEHGNFEAFTLFIDLSGFTSLTETLMKQGKEGAEQLSFHLNSIFEPLVNLVYCEGGFIPYFAGDSFTAIFPKSSDQDTPEVLIKTAELLRDFFQKNGIRKTRFGDFNFGIKIGLGEGDVEWGIVGNEKKAFYFRGEAINAAAQSQYNAEEQEIILNEVFKLKFENFIPAIELKKDEYFRFSKIHEFPDIENCLNQIPDIDLDILSNFFQKEVIQYDDNGEFRNVISVFISFTGVDTHDALNNFVSIVLDEISSFSGYFKEVDFGDKGGVLVAFFGAPVTFENNNKRAIEFVLALEEELKDLRRTTPLNFRIGITSGNAFTGTVGGVERCQYAAVGNRVNLAARIMIYANYGQVLVDETIQKSQYFRFNHKGDIQYKGIDEDIPTYELLGKNIDDQQVFGGKMVGRQKDLEQLINFSKPILNNDFAGVAYLFGEAGIGKSRLSFEMRSQLRKIGSVSWMTCQADQILKKPLNPFIYFLKNYFKQSFENTEVQNIESFERKYLDLYNDKRLIKHEDASQIRGELSRTKSILAAQVGINSSSSLWQQLDAKGRYQNTLAALSNLIIAESCLQPVVLELEDAHWFDQDSIAFLQDFARKMNRHPIFVLVTSRYDDNGEKVHLFSSETILDGKHKILEIDLNILQPEAIQNFAEIKLQAPISSEFKELLLRTTNGNPFYAEQIIEYFSESNLLQKRKQIWHIKDNSLKLSSSINSILMARIDRLSTLVKETVKAAAVIGREFEIPVLNEVMKSQKEFIARNGDATAVLKEQIQTAERGQIWRAVNELRYIFKHSLLREAVYDMQLRARLRRLHRLIAEAIEKLYKEKIEERYADLAFHFGEAEIDKKTNYYLLKAADFNRLKYQNTRALNLYEQLVENYKKNSFKYKKELVNVLLKKASVLRLIGEWDRCQLVYEEAMDLIGDQDESLAGRIHNLIGELLTLKGNYDDAKSHLETAATHFEFTDDSIGKYKVYGNLGTLFFRQGIYNHAKSYFTKSITLSREYNPDNANAAIVSNLGLAHMNEGNYEEAIQWQESELAICQKVNDKQGMANLYTNMGIVLFEKGDYDEALLKYQKGLKLSEDLGNKLLVSIAIGCIGSVYQRKGNYIKASEHFLKDLTIGEELGDKQGIAIALGLLGELRSEEGKFDLAREYLEKNLSLCEELNYRKGIAKAINALADIFMVKKDYEMAISYYSQAIELARMINNKLILGESLVEKGEALIEAGRIDEAQTFHQEAILMIENLGNLDLIFKAKIFSAKLAFAKKEEDKAEQILQDLVKEYTSDVELGDVYFWLYKITQQDNYKNESFTLYRKLYAETPLYLFEKRIKELS
jgi:class 3 adenylate cyclase/tetratricopeptide (TPR) repeat protein